jgi:hypothetical protein
MTEDEWLTGTDPAKLLRHIYNTRKRANRGERKPRRLALEFWRWQAGNLRSGDAERLLRAVALGDEWAESGVKPKIPTSLQDYFVLDDDAWKAARATMRLQINAGTPLAQVAQERKVHLVRELWGNPFHFVPLDPAWTAWNEGTVLRLAQSIYAEETFDTLPILGDALEEAGCADEAILAHLRSPDPHVRGCWVLDLILGKR